MTHRLRHIAGVGSVLWGFGCASTPISHPPPPDPDATPTHVHDVDGQWAPRADQPLVILMSVDGVRADYLDRYDTPAFDRVIQAGVHASGLIPVFPSKTFPNHYTQVTGLYPENHGIVGNTFYDPATNSVFSMESTESHWWGGEPIWVSAEQQGEPAATCFWVGSEAEIDGVRPSWWLPYDGSLSDTARIDQVLAWIDQPTRPSLITVYFSQVDNAGHSDGPDASSIEAAVHEVDAALQRLLDGLQTRNLLDEADVVIVSDHGMSQQSPERLIFLDDYININAPDTYILSWGSMLPLDVPDAEVPATLAALAGVPHLACTAREDTPEHWHYRDSDRISSIVCAADDGWSITSREWYATHPNDYNGGTHGYDPSLESMHGIFLAQGPHFATKTRVDAFSAVEIYNLLAHALSIKPAPNDGNLQHVAAVVAE